MNTRHIWSVLCRKSSIDTDTNNVSIFDVLEDMHLQVPIAFIEKAHEDMRTKGIQITGFEVISLWENLTKTDDAEVILEVKSPTGKVTEMGTNELQFKGMERLRHRWQVGSLMIQETGRHEVVVKYRMIGGKQATEVAVIPLNIFLDAV